jgi:hypothetical protein
MKRGAPSRTIRPPSAMRRGRGEPARTTRPPSAMPIQMRRESGAPTKTIRPPNAMRIERGAHNTDYAATDSNKDSERARCVNADYAATERDSKRAQRVKSLAGERNGDLRSKNLFQNSVIANGHLLSQECVYFMYEHNQQARAPQPARSI